MFRRKNESSPPPYVNQHGAQWAAVWERCGGKLGRRKSGSGMARSGRRERRTAGRTRRDLPSHARWKYACNPCCRTNCNGRTPHNRWEPPKRKSAYRKPGSARAAGAQLPQRSLLNRVCGNVGGCRYDRPDIANSFSPGRSRKEYVKPCDDGKGDFCADLS
jgi:hypothetical protein